MLIGEYIHTIDSKRRLAIPSKFRGDLGKKAVITTGFENCLVLYPMEEWAKKTKKINDLPDGQLDARNFARVTLSNAADVSLDSLGRILIPDRLKDYAFLKKNVAILGLSNKIEIWDEKRWKEYKKKTEMMVGDIAEKLKELGI